MNKQPNSVAKQLKVNDQRGNTMLGFIAGLIVGLLIALVVAWGITRHAPSEKPNVRPPDIAVQPKVSSGGAPIEPKDINQPLKGKTKTSEGSDAVSTESTKKVEPTPEVTNTYWLQVGAYGSKGEAENQKAALAMQGMQASISEFLKDDKKIWRVRIGPIDDSAELQKNKRRLEESGISYSVIKVNKS